MLISEKCGSRELIKEKKNGETFSPYNQDEIAKIMFKYLTKNKNDLIKMGKESLRIIEKDFSVIKYFQGLK